MEALTSAHTSLGLSSQTPSNTDGEENPLLSVNFSANPLHLFFDDFMYQKGFPQLDNPSTLAALSDTGDQHHSCLTSEFKDLNMEANEQNCSSINYSTEGLSNYIYDPYNSSLDSLESDLISPERAMSNSSGSNEQVKNQGYSSAQSNHGEYTSNIQDEYHIDISFQDINLGNVVEENIIQNDCAFSSTENKSSDQPLPNEDKLDFDFDFEGFDMAVNNIPFCNQTTSNEPINRQTDHNETKIYAMFATKIKDGEYEHCKQNTSKPVGYKGEFPKIPTPTYPLTANYSYSVALPTNVARNRICSEKELRIKQHATHKSSSRSIIYRTRYIRGPEILSQLHHENFQYQFSESNSIDSVYDPEIIRVQMHFDEQNQRLLPINVTRYGLCPFCPHLVFYDMRTSAYGQHLAFHHGVCTDGYLTPEPLMYGKYHLKKTGKNRKTIPQKREVNAVICPVCHDFVEVQASQTTANIQPFYGYLRHFKLEHRRAISQRSQLQAGLKTPSLKTFYKKMDLSDY